MNKQENRLHMKNPAYKPLDLMINCIFARRLFLHAV